MYETVRFDLIDPSCGSTLKNSIEKLQKLIMFPIPEMPITQYKMKSQQSNRTKHVLIDIFFFFSVMCMAPATKTMLPLKTHITQYYYYYI